MSYTKSKETKVVTLPAYLRTWTAKNCLVNCTTKTILSYNPKVVLAQLFVPNTHEGFPVLNFSHC